MRAERAGGPAGWRARAGRSECPWAFTSRVIRRTRCAARAGRQGRAHAGCRPRPRPPWRRGAGGGRGRRKRAHRAAAGKRPAGGRAESHAHHARQAGSPVPRGGWGRSEAEGGGEEGRSEGGGEKEGGPADCAAGGRKARGLHSAGPGPPSGGRLAAQHERRVTAVQGHNEAQAEVRYDLGPCPVRLLCNH